MSGLLLMMAFSVVFPAIGFVLVALCGAVVAGMFAGTTILIGELLAIIGAALAPAGASRAVASVRRLLHAAT